MEQYKSTISVILPVYNTGSILQETIDSVLNQTFQDFELIIINDGSSDAVTSDILNKQQDRRIRVINQPNQGVAASRNRGMQEAVGKYIAFLDHDDIFLPEKLEVMVKALNDSPETVLVYTDVVPFGENAEKAHVMPEIEKITYSTLLRANIIYSMSCVMLNAKLLKGSNIRFDGSCVPCDDWDFYLHCSFCGEIRRISPALVKYRLHDNNQSADLIKMYRAGIRVVNKHRSYIKRAADMLSISPRQLKYSVADALSEHHYGLAYHYFKLKKYNSATANFVKGFLNNPLYPKLRLFILKKIRAIFSAK